MMVVVAMVVVVVAVLSAGGDTLYRRDPARGHPDGRKVVPAINLNV